MNIKANITNCIDCPSHEVRPDPDPDDSFCDDDIKVVCNSCKKNITVACRPHHLRDECEISEWCPKRNPMRQQ